METIPSSLLDSRVILRYLLHFELRVDGVICESCTTGLAVLNCDSKTTLLAVVLIGPFQRCLVSLATDYLAQWLRWGVWVLPWLIYK